MTLQSSIIRTRQIRKETELFLKQSCFFLVHTDFYTEKNAVVYMINTIKMYWTKVIMLISVMWSEVVELLQYFVNDEAIYIISSNLMHVVWW